MWLLGSEVRTSEEQLVLLTTEPSLQPQCIFYATESVIMEVHFLFCYCLIISVDYRLSKAINSVFYIIYHEEYVTTKAAHLGKQRQLS